MQQRVRHPGLVICVIVLTLSHPLSVAAVAVRPDWSGFFNRYKAEGTIVVSDERSGSASDMVFNAHRAKKRYSPASTFKIPHALFALEAGAIRDEFQTIKWDGKVRASPAWNHDQNLRSSMRHSVVWVYQKFAHEMGEQKERDYLEKAQYGNQDPTGKNPFWVEGNLRISAVEQIAFLKKLYRNKLPFSVANQRLVKDVMLIEAGRDWILRGKSGWSGTIGWWVGWVEHPDGPVFFALNIDTPHRLADLPKRETIARAVLSSLAALKPNTEQPDGPSRE
ncbi:MAG: class D beta-lactamase [Akkermansiaceae bacterium]|nr:class D beta-lactamase [Akkermansiaceae bacterium]